MNVSIKVSTQTVFYREAPTLYPDECFIFLRIYDPSDFRVIINILTDVKEG